PPCPPCSAEPFADRATAASAPRTHSARPPRKPTGLPRTAPGGDPVDLSLHLVALRIVEDPWRDLRLRARALPRSANLGYLRPRLDRRRLRTVLLEHDRQHGRHRGPDRGAQRTGRLCPRPLLLRWEEASDHHLPGDLLPPRGAHHHPGRAAD